MEHVSVGSAELKAIVVDLFEALGAATEDAELVADSLVTADLEGVSSHGVALLPMYVERIRAGSVSLQATPTLTDDHGALVIMSANNSLGHKSAQVAVNLSIERAVHHAVSVVSVRNAFHFGTAAYWTRQFAERGMIGIAMCNTRPLMPPPGGAQRVVGNNPLSLAFPSNGARPLVVDMATSAAAMGKIRVAATERRAIPLGWATDVHGRDTSSASEAVDGFLLPAAGPKGFALAVAIELLSGGLSGGGIGEAVSPLYGSPEIPYNSSHTFISIDAARLNINPSLGTCAESLAETIRHAKRAPGVDTLYAPGDRRYSRYLASDGKCTLPARTVEDINRLLVVTGVGRRLSS